MHFGDRPERGRRACPELAEGTPRFLCPAGPPAEEVLAHGPATACPVRHHLGGPSTARRPHTPRPHFFPPPPQPARRSAQDDRIWNGRRVAGKCAIRSSVTFTICRDIR